MPLEYLKILRIPHKIAIDMHHHRRHQRLPLHKDMRAVRPKNGGVHALDYGSVERGGGRVLAFEHEEIVEVA